MDAFTQWVTLAVEQFNWRQPGWLYPLPLLLLAMLWWRSRVQVSRGAAQRLSLYARVRFWPLVVRGVRLESIEAEQDAVRDMLPWFGAALLLLALAGPRWLHEQQTVFRQGSDIVVVMDISSSMRTADVLPDRLTRAREELQDFLARLHGDRVGLVAFAARAFTIAPLTTDYSAITRFADQLDPGMVSEQGSNLAAGLLEALKVLRQARGHGRAVVLLTDGEDHAHGESMAAAAKLADAHVPLFILGIGTEKGGLVPTGDGRFVHDIHGDAALSRMMVDHMKELAQAGDGIYASSRWDDEDWRALYDDGIRRRVERTNSKEKTRMRWHEEFGLLLLPAMLLFGLWWRRSYRQWLA
jgi:Ca-activated chloride channel homolog